MINFSDKNNKTAFIATGIIHLVVLLILVFSYIHYNFVPLPDNNDKNDITFFGGEYVILGDVPNSAVDAHESAPEPVKTAEKPVANDLDTKNSGSAGEEAAPKISTEKESPMKVEKKKVPEKSGPTKEELEEQERIKAEKEAKRKTNSKVQNAFGKTSSKSGSGKVGSTNGNSTTGARTGAPGVSGLNGYTIASWGRPSSPVDGKVVIKVRVNARGKVIAANYSSGSGTAAANMAVRRSCEQASLQSSFSVPVGTTDEAVGYITWRFE